RRLGFSLCGPDGIDYLSTRDSDDDLRLQQSISVPAPEEMPSQGEESEERAPVQTRPNGRDLQSESSLGEQETVQTQSSKAVVVRKQKKKSKAKKVKSRPPAEVDRTHMHVGNDAADTTAGKVIEVGKVGQKDVTRNELLVTKTPTTFSDKNSALLVMETGDPHGGLVVYE
ncbi:MAG: hypothetical protein GY739_18645, partial [Mesoflavibacter sp.]|nr:hypothetical protein [Mesoflavibacter sp.]